MSRPGESVPRSIVVLALAAWMTLAGAREAAAQITDKPIDAVIVDIAAEVAEVAKGESQTSLVISGFDNKFDKKKPAGKKFLKEIVDELKKLQIEAKDEALLSLTGEFRVANAKFKGEEVPTVRISYKLTKMSGQVLLDTEKPVGKEAAKITKDVPAVLEMGGITAQVQPNDAKGTEKKLAGILKDKEDDKTSTVVIDGTKIRPQAGSKFAVEILKVKDEDPTTAPPQASYKPVTPLLRKGLPFVDIQPDEVYAVKVYNDNAFEIVSTLSIDGLSMFSFSKERDKRPEFWLFQPNEPYALFGWHREHDVFDTFLVKEYSQDEVGKSIKDDSAFGQIFLEFRAAFTDLDHPPPDEDPELIKKLKGARGLKTEIGRPTTMPITEVNRHIGKTRASITVRYDRNFPDTP